MPDTTKGLVSWYDKPQFHFSHCDPEFCFELDIVEQYQRRRAFVTEEMSVPFIPNGPTNEHGEGDSRFTVRDAHSRVVDPPLLDRTLKMPRRSVKVLQV